MGCELCGERRLLHPGGVRRGFRQVAKKIERPKFCPDPERVLFLGSVAIREKPVKDSFGDCVRSGVIQHQK